jgi:chemotaxis protein MotB
MKLSGLNFDVGKATLRPDAFPILKQLAEILNEYPEITAKIIGHTDASPIRTKEFRDNFALSRARSKAVITYLVTKEKTDIGRISSEGFGETKPVATNKTKEGKALNRCLESLSVMTVLLVSPS